MKNIIKRRIIDQGDNTEFDRLNKRYNNAIKNTSRFNRGFVSRKTSKRDNGYVTKFFRKKTNDLLSQWYLISKNQGWELGVITYNRTKN